MGQHFILTFLWPEELFERLKFEYPNQNDHIGEVTVVSGPAVTKVLNETGAVH